MIAFAPLAATAMGGAMCHRNERLSLFLSYALQHCHTICLIFAGADRFGLSWRHSRWLLPGVIHGQTLCLDFGGSEPVGTGGTTGGCYPGS